MLLRLQRVQYHLLKQYAERLCFLNKNLEKLKMNHSCLKIHGGGGGVGGVGGGVRKITLCLKPVGIMLETSNLTRKYTPMFQKIYFLVPRPP